MSTIKVNNIQARSGTTLTLGQSGDTVTLPSGVTFNATNATVEGISGGIDYQTTAKTSAFTAVAGEGYFVDTTSAAITATLPASPSAGDQVAFKDYAGTFATNNLSIDRNGSNIQGNSKNGVLSTDRASVVMIYVDATKGWLFINESNVGDLTIAPEITSIAGNIFVGASSTLTLTGLNFEISSPTTLTVNFFQALDSIDVDVDVTPASDTSASVTVPSSVYNNVTNGRDVSIKVTNVDGGESNSVLKTAIALPTGGSITSYSNFRVHTFTSSGTFAAPSGFAATADILVVAGGGSGGYRAGGGGGAGGFRTSTTASIAPNTSYPITVGSGGAGATDQPGVNGTNGSDSSGISITSTGGGRGTSAQSFNGFPGGSGGGGGGPTQGGSGNTPSFSPPQGNPGGNGAGDGGSRNGGGGGGASQSGIPANSPSTPRAGGDGGDGSSNDFRTGSPITYAGGGGGSVHSGQAGLGGDGGGGNGGSDGQPVEAGDANTGGGGGSSFTDNANGGNGGSGIVVIRYET